jgi:hypothetical protein
MFRAISNDYFRVIRILSHASFELGFTGTKTLGLKGFLLASDSTCVEAKNLLQRHFIIPSALFLSSISPRTHGQPGWRGQDDRNMNLIERVPMVESLLPF